MYVALVDLSCNEEVLELVKSALAAALEALPPAGLFGLITFSDKVSSVPTGMHRRQKPLRGFQWASLLSACSYDSYMHEPRGLHSIATQCSPRQYCFQTTGLVSAPSLLSLLCTSLLLCERAMA